MTLETQRAEFNAVAELAAQYRRIELCPIVDDDYPEVRHGYESALRSLLDALAANGRVPKPEVRTPDGYAYRYHDCIRFNGGEQVNGNMPKESIPYYFQKSGAKLVGPPVPEPCECTTCCEYPGYPMAPPPRGMLCRQRISDRMQAVGK